MIPRNPLMRTFKMSFTCAEHGWQHSQSPCPICNPIKADRGSMKFSGLDKTKTFLVYPDESVITYEVGNLVEIEDKMYQVIQVDRQHGHIMFRKVILKQ